MSKVVDENGEPLIVYHGTDSEFDTFKPIDEFTKNKGEWGRKDFIRKGFYFTDQSRFAKSYGEKIIPAFLSDVSRINEFTMGGEGKIGRAHV